jgi:hypothetical protein
LCFLPTNSYTPFVTWLQTTNTKTGESSMFHGDYHRKLKTALAAFEKRSAGYGETS